MIRRQNNLQPGDMVSLDQYVSRAPGRLPHTAGKENKKNKYAGGTIFVDHASQYIFLRHQVGLTAAKTLKAKIAYEQMSESCGVKIKGYLADNVPFGSKAFMEDVSLKDQSIRFSGVGAHYQNGVAERNIRTVTQLARAMMIHLSIMWPDQANLEVWPFALDQAVYIYNNTPKANHRKSPTELFTKSISTNTSSMLHCLHVFGCSAYVLDLKL